MSHAKSHSIKPYLAVFAALMVLTVVTVAVSHIHMPRTLALIVGITIAVIKASLVAMFFMHLKDEGKLIWSLIALCAVFIVVMFTLPWVDTRDNLTTGRSHQSPVVMDDHPTAHAQKGSPAGEEHAPEPAKPAEKPAKGSKKKAAAAH